MRNSKQPRAARTLAARAWVLVALGPGAAMPAARSQAATSPPGYLLEDLQTQGGPDSMGHAINAVGDVAGWSTTASGMSHAVL